MVVSGKMGSEPFSVFKKFLAQGRQERKEKINSPTLAYFASLQESTFSDCRRQNPAKNFEYVWLDFISRTEKKTGASGYVTKQEMSETVLIAIRRVLNGEKYLSAKTEVERIHK